jgi:hypothetical protein
MQMSEELASESSQQFMSRFNEGNVSVFIVVKEGSGDNKPMIALIHRLRFGRDILPLPAWLSREEAERFLQSQQQNRPDLFGDSKIIEIRHTELQTMIDERRYDSSYPRARSYYLDLQS